MVPPPRPQSVLVMNNQWTLVRRCSSTTLAVGFQFLCSQKALSTCVQLFVAVCFLRPSSLLVPLQRLLKVRSHKLSCVKRTIYLYMLRGSLYMKGPEFKIDQSEVLMREERLVNKNPPMNLRHMMTPE